MTLRSVVWATVLLSATQSFRYERPVQLANANTAETCVALPIEIFAHAAPTLRDLRVVADGREIAYQLRISGEGNAAESAHAVQILNLGERNGEVSFDAEMTEPRYSRVVLRLGRGSFSILVHVSGIDRPGEPGVSLPDYAWSSSDASAGTEQRVIMLPESSFPYLHFDLKTLALEPVHPQDVAGIDVLSPKAVPVRYVDAAVAVGPQQKAHHSVYEFTVPANTPIERLRFTSGDRNAIFTREATLERQGAGGDSPEASMLTLAQTAHPVPVRESGLADAALAPVPAPSKATLTIDNGDDAPLSLASMQLQTRERQVCFLSKPGTAYALRYGNASLMTPQYDVSPIEAAAATASSSSLGPERILAEGVDTDLRPFTEQHPTLLWAALILVVGTLGLVALRSARG